MQDIGHLLVKVTYTFNSSKKTFLDPLWNLLYFERFIGTFCRLDLQTLHPRLAETSHFGLLRLEAPGQNGRGHRAGLSPLPVSVRMVR